MNISVEIRPAEEKDHYYLFLNGLKLGKHERSQVCQIVQTFDNGLNINHWS